MLVFFTYVFHEARFRECKFTLQFIGFSPRYAHVSLRNQKKIYFHSFWDYFTDLWAYTKQAL
jgi:hypothetical protein